MTTPFFNSLLVSGLASTFTKFWQQISPSPINGEGKKPIF
jgi:hypothetical protein